MILQLLTILLPLFLLACFYRCSSNLRQRRASLHEPPSPFKLPVIGNLHQLGSLPHRSLRGMSRVHGPVMLLRLGSQPVLVVSSPDTAQEVMKTHDAAFASRPSTSIGRDIYNNCTDVIFAPYGEHWRQAKMLCTVHLLSAKRVRSYAAVREEEVATMVKRIAAWSATMASPVNLSPILNSLANEVVTRVAVGSKYYTQREDTGRNDFCDIVDEIAALFSSFDVEDYFPWLRWLGAATAMSARKRRCFQKVDNFLEQVLDDHLGGRKKDGDGGDLIDVLLSLQDDGDSASSLSKDTIKAIILDMFIAGTDTSYITLEWAMAELIRSPEAMEKVQGEVRKVAKGENTMVTEDELANMTYLDAVIKEALRLHPPAPLLLPRESIEAGCKVGGYAVAAKTRVVINAWAIGRDPDCWEAPEEFRPDRFIDDAVDFRGQDFRYIPFGAGRRMCPGIAFATAIIKLALANVLHRFDWELPDGMRAEDMDMAEAPGITTRKKSNLLLIAKPRWP